MRRRRLDYRQVVQTPLMILAGLPNPVDRAVAKLVEEKFSPTPRVVSGASGNDDRQLYKEGTISTLMRATSGYAARHLKTDPVPQVPKHIILAYVPSDDVESLLTAFEFFVFPVRLTLLADYDEYGRQRRHDLRIARAYVLASLEAALLEFMEIKRRLATINDKEPLFMPPQNFKTSDSERMADVFKKIVRQAVSWAEPLSDIRLAKVTNQDLPKHVRPGAQKLIISDARGLLFPTDRGLHGPARELMAEASVEERTLFMRSRYRFGVPLSDGFHHDVQYGDRGLKDEVFDCCVEGPLKLTCSYANVYPNDFVRPSQK